MHGSAIVPKENTRIHKVSSSIGIFPHIKPNVLFFGGLLMFLKFIVFIVLNYYTCSFIIFVYYNKCMCLPYMFKALILEGTAGI